MKWGRHARQSAPTRYLMTTLIFFARSGRFLS
ncbi:MAG: hypothetical protein H6R26_3460, partial [Proteobacteria bacterium]|nr:hypothetical protein [Pseudomonadota bacterium]